MAKRRESVRVTKRNPLIISILEKEEYTPEDFEALHEQLVLFAMTLGSQSPPLFIAPRLTIGSLVVTVHVQDRARDIVRTYSFNPDCCRRRITSSKKVQVMKWPDAIQDLFTCLQRHLRKKEKEYSKRANAYRELADGMAIITEAVPAAKVS